MASIFESVKAFEQRISVLGLDDLSAQFRVLGWDRVSVLAFASDYVPGSSDPEVFIKEVVKPLVGDEAEKQNKYKPLLKRLFTEAYTMAAHDVQNRSEAKDSDEPRKMPSAEREHRLRQLGERLVGLNVEDEMRPSNRLVDLCAAMHDTGIIKYISWEERAPIATRSCSA